MMEREVVPTTAGNINERWTLNIFENLKLLEGYERLAREGCSSLLEYAKVPPQIRKAELGIIQYKNVKLIVNEFRLLLQDLSPLLEDEEDKEFFSWIQQVEAVINNEKLFLERYTNLNGELIETRTTPFLYLTINTYAELKIKLLKREKIKNLLYVQSSRPW